MRTLTPLFLLFALAAAAALGQDSKDCPVEILSVEPREAVEGDPLLVTFKVTNDTKDRILVVGARTCPCGSVEWTEGHMYLNPETSTDQAWYIDRIKQLVLPGETRELTEEAVAVSGTLPVQVAYAWFDVKDKKDLLWGEDKVDEDGRIRFDRLDLTTIKTHRGPLVLVFEPAKWETTRKNLSGNVSSRDFSFDAAYQKLDAHVDSARWLKDRKAWLLYDQKSAALVSTASVVKLPAGAQCLFEGVPLKTYDFRIASAESKLGKEFGASRGEGYRIGTFIQVPASRLLEALEIARAERLSIKKRTFAAGRMFFDTTSRNH